MGRSKLNTQVSSLGDRVEGEYKKSRFFLKAGVGSWFLLTKNHMQLKTSVGIWVAYQKLRRES